MGGFVVWFFFNAVLQKDVESRQVITELKAVSICRSRGAYRAVKRSGI